MKKTKPKPLGLSQTTKTVSATFYNEQLPNGENALYTAIRNTSPTDLIVIAIKHEGSSKKKDHYHLIVKDPDNNGSFVVKSILAKLNVQYRPDKDMALLSGRALETTGSFSSCLSYILHKSYSAQRLKKKEYEITDLIANIPYDEIQSILDGYSPASTKLSSEDLIDAARNAGYSLEDFDKTLENMNIRGLTERTERTMRNAYFAGAEKKVREGHRIDRLCIEITYTYDQYRAAVYATDKALSGKSTVVINDSNDSIYISPSTKALKIHRLGFVDKYKDKLLSQKVELIKKSGDYDIMDGKAIWAGDYVIIFKTEGSDVPTPSCCFQCSIKNNTLFNIQPPSHYLLSKKNLSAIREKYLDFRDQFNAALEEFNNVSNTNYQIDVSDYFSNLNN